MLRLLALLGCLASPAAAFELEHDRGRTVLDAPPKRIAVLSWGLAELLTEIDIPMVGVAEADAYQTWVVNPALPDGIQNLGMRNEPNLELLAALEPDLILATDLQAQLMPQISKKARKLHLTGKKATALPVIRSKAVRWPAILDRR